MTLSLLAASCTGAKEQTPESDFDYTVDRFADIEVLRYKVPDFDSLNLKQKTLIYYLQEAALWGRDILWDQKYKHNLDLRRLLEAVYTNYDGDRESDEWKAFETYVKQVWFANGIHHHYSNDKFVPAFSREFLENRIAALPEGSAPASTGEILEVIFNPALDAKNVNQAEGEDLVATSACNMYADGITQAEVEAYFAKLKKADDPTPISYGLNTRIERDEKGNITERQYRLGGLYSDAIAHIVENLDSAANYAENDAQRKIIERLVDFYRSGDLATFDDYSIRWAEDTVSQVDFINGFIESYGDPLGMTGSWESIRAAHGSKSVTIENITQAYDEASHGNGFNEEFVIDEDTRKLLDDYLFITDNLHTDLHECLGHGSGRLLPGVDPDALKAHGSTLEETRADLFALYYLADPKLLEIGLLDNPDAYKAEYYKYILNGLMTQLMRIEPGKDVEEAHMRNRKIIAEWALEHGRDANVIELVKRDGKTFVKINDYEALRGLFGDLLAEIQRIRSTGDYAAGAALVEKYGVKVDPELHREVLDRYSTLDIAPYRGFVNPVYTAVRDASGKITDVTVDYSEDYPSQMLRYAKEYPGLTAGK